MKVNLQAEINDIDYITVISMIKNSISPTNIMHTAALKIIDTQSPETVIYNLIGIKFIKDMVIKKVNKAILSHGYSMSLCDFSLSNAGIPVTLSFTADFGNFSDLAEIAEKHVHTDDVNKNSIIISAIKAFMTEFEDEQKLSFVKKITENSNREICTLIGNTVSKKLFSLNINKITLN